MLAEIRLELRTKTLSTLEKSFSHPIALLFADIISLGPHAHFCPEPREKAAGSSALQVQLLNHSQLQLAPSS